MIRHLKPEHHSTLSRQQSKIKSLLGDVYSHLLADRDFGLIVDQERVKPRRSCVWDTSRSVVRSGRRVPAIIPIDEPLPDRRACLDCGRWEESGSDESSCTECGSARLAVQPRRIWGWVGIQRYLSPTDYGIDFIRNGRKILVRNHSLFRWIDPDDPTGRGEQEYPIEVPRAGRIVGEIHIDHVRVNYLKNAFEYDTPDWKRVVRVLRGEGPLLPKRAKALGYMENVSPLARLLAGYRRADAGLGYLIPGDGRNALHERAREWAERFRKGDPDFLTDEKWYQAATQHDEPPEPPTEPVPDPDDILGTKGLLLPAPINGTGPAAPQPPPEVPETEDDRRERWRSAGTHLPDLEGPFGLRGYGAALKVTTWLVHGHRLRRSDSPDRVPVYVAAGRGATAEVFIDAEHPVFADFAVDTRDLVVMELAEFLRVRNSDSDRALSSVFYDLKDQCLPDHKIAGSYLTGTAGTLLSRVREGMQPVVAGNSSGYWSLVSPEDKSVTEARFATEGGYASWDDLLSSGEWIDYAPGTSLVRLVGARPEAFLDGRVFRSAHQSLNDPTAKKVSAERIVDLLGDVAVLADRPARRARRGPEELQRGRLSCLILERELTSNGDGQ
ncbi:MAG: ATP-binding protein [Pseudonocardia sp.]